MEIIPSHPYPTNSSAELRVFDKLRESFIDDKSYVAFHSLNLTKHTKKRFGEADFVLITKFGIFVLEVKGGRIKHENGIWHTINRHQDTYRIQDPFRQAETALHAIDQEIKCAGKCHNLILPIGYGVIFPDVKWKQNGSEWDRHTVCDLKDFRNFERWLKNLFAYWKSKPANQETLSPQAIKEIKIFLRPNFELIEPLNEKLAKLENVAVELTNDQYRYLDIVAANCRVLCTGGAGTGKTFLAAELARRFGNENKNIIFVCKSNWLRRYLETKINSEYVTVSTIASVVIDKKRAGIDAFDTLIVDEGQDLFNFDDIELLDSIINGGLKDGEWYIFHDVNNQSGLFSHGEHEQTLEVLNYLKDHTHTNVPLTTNCRNTTTILKKIQNTLHLDMGNNGTGTGPDICEFKASRDIAANHLKSKITQFLKSGISPASITILSPFSYEESLVASLPPQIKDKIIKLDDFAIREFPIKKLVSLQ